MYVVPPIPKSTEAIFHGPEPSKSSLGTRAKASTRVVEEIFAANWISSE
jgi:hypothetical protein